MCGWILCSCGSPLEMYGCMPLKSLQKKTGYMKLQSRSLYHCVSCSTFITILQECLQENYIVFCVNTGHTKLSTIMNTILSICFFSDHELRATELLLWSLRKVKMKLTDSINYTTILIQQGQKIKVLKAIAQN